MEISYKERDEKGNLKTKKVNVSDEAGILIEAIRELTRVIKNGR